MIKVSLIVLAGLVVTTLLRRRSAALRHWILASTLICAAATPLLERIVPVWNLPAGLSWMMPQRDELTFDDSQVAPGIAATPARTSAASTGLKSTRAPLPLEAIWLLGTLLGVSTLAIGFGRLAWIVSRSREVTDGAWFDTVARLDGDRKRNAPIRLLQSDRTALLVTWGLRQPTVILPHSACDWPADRVRAVLGHELAHVQRRDWALQMVAELLRCAYWFNPLMWIACHRLRQTSEQACDDAVLNTGMAAPEYAAHLLEVARAFSHGTRRSMFPVMAIVRPSQLERRVRVMLNTGIRRSPITPAACAGTIFGLLLLTVPIAGLGTSNPSSPSTTSGAGIIHETQSASADRVLSVIKNAETPKAPGRAQGPAAMANGTDGASANVPPTEPIRDIPQQTTASVSGTVMDSTGRTMPGAVIVLVNRQTTRRLEMKTGDNGQFAANDIPAGNYQFEIQKPGFMRILKLFSLSAGEVLRQDVVPQLGRLTETVHVQYDAAAAAAASTSPAAPAQPQVVPASAIPPDPCLNSPVGGCVTPPRKLVDWKPVYPADRAASGVSGSVDVECRLGTDGFLKDFRASEGADPAFTAAAIEAVRRWQFSPVGLNGIPQEVRVMVTVQFTAVK